MLGDIWSFRICDCKDLEGKVLNLLGKKDTEVCPGNIDTCYWIKSLAGPKKVIIKMSRRNEADKF